MVTATSFETDADHGYKKLDVDEVQYEPKNIAIASYVPEPRHASIGLLPLIFTHGAGGSMFADAVTNFRDGFAIARSFVCFQGNMNLSSRVKMFDAVATDQGPDGAVLGGRSMGARASVVCANGSQGRYKQLVLVSYPLNVEKNGELEMRDQILLDLDAGCDVLFMLGDRDSMCDLDSLHAVRLRMNCKTWLVLVKGANHGMEVKPKAATRDVGKMTGTVAADWLAQRDVNVNEGVISWDEDAGKAEWSGWMASLPDEQRLASASKNVANEGVAESTTTVAVEEVTNKPNTLTKVQDRSTTLGANSNKAKNAGKKRKIQAEGTVSTRTRSRVQDKA